jgi:hypothetical protein
VKWILLLTALLTGCATTGVTTAPVATDGTVKFDERLVADCKPLPKLEDTTDVVLLDYTKQLFELYADCAKAKKLENEEVKKAFNLSAQ